MKLTCRNLVHSKFYLTIKRSRPFALLKTSLLYFECSFFQHLGHTLCNELSSSNLTFPRKYRLNHQAIWEKLFVISFSKTIPKGIMMHWKFSQRKNLLLVEINSIHFRNHYRQNAPNSLSFHILQLQTF